MESSFEIGHRVKWSINKNVHCKGIFIETLNPEQSLVKCYERNGVACVIKVEVISSLLSSQDAIS